jgi:hypothetical protein
MANCLAQKLRPKSLLVSFALLPCLALASISGCGSNYGTKLTFKNGELYYTSGVTKDEADKLGNFLVKSGFFDGEKKSVQLNKEDGTYQVRLVIKPGFENNAPYIEQCKQAAKEVSQNVFQGAPVVIHLCDDQLKTLKVVQP